jgi:hypothetical protein
VLPNILHGEEGSSCISLAAVGNNRSEGSLRIAVSFLWAVAFTSSLHQEFKIQSIKIYIFQTIYLHGM